MSYDGDFESYSDGAGAHQQGLANRHIGEVRRVKIPRPGRRFAWERYEGECTCGLIKSFWSAAEAEQFLDGHAERTGGIVLRAGKP